MREIDWQIIPSRSTHALRLILGKAEVMLSEDEFERVLAKGEGTLMKLDKIKRKRGRA